MSELPTRDFGSTGLRTAVIGMGGAFLDADNAQQGIEAVRHALKLGVNYIDTSPMYCRGQSQAILGEALRGVAEPFILATKLGYLPTPADHRSVHSLRAQVRDNLRALRRDAVDVLQVHEADLTRWWTDDPAAGFRIKPDEQHDYDNAPVMRVLRESRDAGLCRFIGITGNGADEMATVLGGVKVDTFLPALSNDLIWRSAHRRALPLAAKRGVATLAGGVLQCGRLAAINDDWLATPPDWMTPDLRQRFATLYAIARDTKLSLPELTIRYMLADERLHVILLGARSPAEVEAGIAAACAGPLPADVHAALQAVGSEML